MASPIAAADAGFWPVINLPSTTTLGCNKVSALTERRWIPSANLKGLCLHKFTTQRFDLVLYKEGNGLDCVQLLLFSVGEACSTPSFEYRFAVGICDFHQCSEETSRKKFLGANLDVRWSVTNSRSDFIGGPELTRSQHFSV